MVNRTMVHYGLTLKWWLTTQVHSHRLQNGMCFFRLGYLGLLWEMSILCERKKDGGYQWIAYPAHLGHLFIDCCWLMVNRTMVHYGLTLKWWLTTQVHSHRLQNGMCFFRLGYLGLLWEMSIPCKPSSLGIYVNETTRLAHLLWD